MPMLGKSIRAVMEAPIPKVKDLARGRKDVVSFAQGLPWFGPPAAAVDRLLDRLRNGEGAGYSDDLGRERLRELLAADLRNRGIAGAAVERLCVTPGANQAVYIALAALADPGDEVILFKPYFFNNLMALQLLGLKPVLVEAGPDGAIEPGDVRRRIGSRTRAMILISPNNPTGAVADRNVLDELLRLAREHRLVLISDEAYRDFAWDSPHVSPLASDSENVIGIFSFSKSFGMAGWRLGFMSAPRELIVQAVKAADTLHICPPVPAQMLAEEILVSEPAYPEQFRKDMKEARDRLIAALRPLHERGLIGKLRGAGGFYLFIRLEPEIARSGWEIARRLVDEFALAVVPGEAFGMDEHPYLRLSYGNIRAAEMGPAADRLAEALGILLRG
ncbi:MAG: pyridoxal phosphate-dependent aminotransferase [Candidatus Aminicenantales bacterium]